MEADNEVLVVLLGSTLHGCLEQISPEFLHPRKPFPEMSPGRSLGRLGAVPYEPAERLVFRVIGI